MRVGERGEERVWEWEWEWSAGKRQGTIYQRWIRSFMESTQHDKAALFAKLTVFAETSEAGHLWSLFCELPCSNYIRRIRNKAQPCVSISRCSETLVETILILFELKLVNLLNWYEDFLSQMLRKKTPLRGIHNPLFFSMPVAPIDHFFSKNKNVLSLILRFRNNCRNSLIVIAERPS